MGKGLIDFIKGDNTVKIVFVLVLHFHAYMTYYCSHFIKKPS